MTRREASLEFLRAFCAGDIESLGALLTEDFRFEGPLHRSDSRSAYLSTLKKDPPKETANFNVFRVFEEDEEVCLIYEYSAEPGSVLIAQWNRFRGDKIAEMTLVFDARGFG
jgi:hypothetical protein